MDVSDKQLSSILIKWVFSLIMKCSRKYHWDEFLPLPASCNCFSIWGWGAKQWHFATIWFGKTFWNGLWYYMYMIYHTITVLFDVSIKTFKTKIALENGVLKGYLTHWGWNKMAPIFQMAFWNAFSGMKMYEFQLKFHWSLFLSIRLTMPQHWFR